MSDHTAFGMTLRLPFPCPALPCAPEGANPDIVIREAPVPRRLASPACSGLQWEAEPGRYLWRGGKRSGRFLVEVGRVVTLERNPQTEEPMLAFHFLSSVLAALLRQRGFLVLHANAALVPAGAIAICGESGAGKSSTLAALLSRGCSMLSDDVTVLRCGEGGRVEVLPGVPQLHLCEDAAGILGQDISGIPLQPWRRQKAAVPTQSRMAGSPAPLVALFRLGIHPGTGLRVESLEGSAKFAALQECVYGPLLAEEHSDCFELFSAVANQVAVYRVDRPERVWSMDAIVELILSESRAGIREPWGISP